MYSISLAKARDKITATATTIFSAITTLKRYFIAFQHRPKLSCVARSSSTSKIMVLMTYSSYVIEEVKWASAISVFVHVTSHSSLMT